MDCTEKNRSIAIKGLSSSEAKKSFELYGNNHITVKKQKSFLRRYIDNFTDPIIRVLLISLFLHALFSLGHIDWFETGGIIVAIFLSTIVSTISEYGSEKAFSKMQNSAMDSKCIVIRDAVKQCISIDSLVRGDVVVLSAGQTVPADGVLLDGKIYVDQSALNGESEEVEKISSQSQDEFCFTQNLNRSNLLFRGSVILSGECKFRVERCGNETLYGQIANELQEDTRESPLRVRLNQLAKQISIFGYASAIVVALIYIFNAIIIANQYNLNLILVALRNFKTLFPILLNAFTLAITIVVVSVPEGLPMMVAVVLSSNMKRMLKDQVLVKKMVGIETAGSMNILFCDKTGTLTTGKMRINSFIFGDESLGNSLALLSETSTLYHLLNMSAFYNTGSCLSNGMAIGGNHTDRAILEYFKKNSKAEALVLKHIPFDSRFRFEAIQLSEKEKYTLIKGAPELLLPLTKYYIDKDNRQVEFNERSLASLRRRWKNAAAQGERVIAVCKSDEWKHTIQDYDDLILVSLICIKDKLRRDAKESVLAMQGAGIQVVMITGDNISTAMSIAEECGIHRNNSNCITLTGDEMTKLTDDELMELLPKLTVIARALPTDKSRLVRIAQKKNLVVGMTGDGVNDAPSLKLADVGFSMGEGTDIAKEAGDIVLLDGSIRSIVNTVLYGRTIFHSIRKFISFQLMMNISAVFVSLLGQYLGIGSPITIIQMLWVNMIMDTLGGLAFAGEPPLQSYLKEKPKKRDEGIIDRQMLSRICYGSAFLVSLFGAFMILPYFRTVFDYWKNPTSYFTSFFVLFIFSGVFTCFNVRTGRINLFADISKNKAFTFIMLFVSFVQITIVCIGGDVFRTVPLQFDTWIKVILLAFMVIPLDFLRKSFNKLSHKRN